MGILVGVVTGSTSAPFQLGNREATNSSFIEITVPVAFEFSLATTLPRLVFLSPDPFLDDTLASTALALPLSTRRC